MYTRPSPLFRCISKDFVCFESNTGCPGAAFFTLPTRGSPDGFPCSELDAATQQYPLVCNGQGQCVAVPDPTPRPTNMPTTKRPTRMPSAPSQTPATSSSTNSTSPNQNKNQPFAVERNLHFTSHPSPKRSRPSYRHTPPTDTHTTRRCRPRNIRRSFATSLLVCKRVRRL